MTRLIESSNLSGRRTPILTWAIKHSWQRQSRERKNCLVLHPHILYFTRKGKWSVWVCECVWTCVCAPMCVFASKTEILLKCFRHQYEQPGVFKATPSYLKIRRYNNVNSWRNASPDSVLGVFGRFPSEGGCCNITEKQRRWAKVHDLVALASCL